MFEDISPSELRYQTAFLLDLLLCISKKNNIIQSLKPPRNLLPLQNLCLYLEASRIEQRPLGALRPLDETSLAWAMIQIFSRG